MKKVFERFTSIAKKIVAAAVFAAGTVIIAQAQTQPSIAQKQSSGVTQSSTAQTPAASSPTSLVQEFYRAMRERRFREALMMTNLRGAVETLTPAEIEDLRPDFEPMAARVPQTVETSGEQISNSLASVYVKNTDATTGESKLDQLKLRRENNSWIILTADTETEALAKTAGKKYFFDLRIEARHAEIELTLRDIIKAELAYSVQNNNLYADLQTLANQQLIAAEVIDPQIMGYRFRLQLSPDKKKYTVNAEPVQYGKTGKLSFLLDSNAGKGSPQIESADKNGAALSAKN